MSNNINKKLPETPVERYNRLIRSQKHEKKLYERAKRNLEKTEKEISFLMKKLWFCPKCNIPHQIPNKKNIKEQVETHFDEKAGIDNFYKCRYAQCEVCGNWVLINSDFLGEDD